MKKIDCWKIRILSTSNFNIFNPFRDADVILELDKCEHSKYSILPSHTINIQADPFLFVNNNILYLFYESKSVGQKGVIMMTFTKDTKVWSKPIVVLKESCHLSYPFVFEDDGIIYMIPETGGLKCVRLYKATNESLTEWKFVKNLINDDLLYSPNKISWCDSSIVKIDGIYYLFSTINRNNTNELHLFYSNNIHNDFVEHSFSPICISNKLGRNAGNIIQIEKHLYRVAQDCEISYGEDINILEITAISPTEYNEKLISDKVIKDINSFYKNGGHQLSIVDFNDKTIIATDAKSYKTMLIPRLISKIIN